VLIAAFALVAAAGGLFVRSGTGPFAFTTLRGQQAQIFGQGLYRYDTVFFGAGFKGQDAVVLFLAIPLLLISLVWSSRGSLAGHLLFIGILGYFLYVYASMALGAAFNPFFLVYVAIFSASLFAFVHTFSSLNPSSIAAHIERLPGRGIAVFMFLAGLVTLTVWGAPLVTALAKAAPPEKMDIYTTMVTYALDLAIITPATFLCAFLVLRGNPLGYALAVTLLTIILLLAPQIVLSTIFQRSAGIPFTPGELIGPIAGFVILGSAAAWFLFNILRTVQSPA